MTNFYTNVQAVGSNILFRGVVNGKKIKNKIAYQPRLFELAKKVTPYTTLNGEYLQEIKFDSMREARDYLRQFEGVSGKKIYGNSRFEYAFIADQYKGMIEWDLDKISIAILDIEVGSENGFPDPYQANEPVTAISVKYVNGDIYVFGCGDYKVKGEERYTKCVDEYNLLKFFLKFHILLIA
jgi:hypothetical protein